MKIIKGILKYILSFLLLFTISVGSTMLVIKTFSSEDNIDKLISTIIEKNNIDISNQMGNLFTDTGLPREIKDYLDENTLKDFYTDYFIGNLKYQLNLGKEPNFYSPKYIEYLNNSIEKYEKDNSVILDKKVYYDVINDLSINNKTHIEQPKIKPQTQTIINILFSSTTPIIIVIIFMISNIIMLIIKGLHETIKTNFLSFGLNTICLVIFKLSLNTIFAKKITDTNIQIILDNISQLFMNIIIISLIISIILLICSIFTTKKKQMPGTNIISQNIV